jgi:hypothetical protein
MNRIVVALEPLSVPDALLDWIERLSADEVANFARRVNADLIVVGGADHSALHDVMFGGFARRLGNARLQHHPRIAMQSTHRRRRANPIDELTGSRDVGRRHHCCRHDGTSVNSR